MLRPVLAFAAAAAALSVPEARAQMAPPASVPYEASYRGVPVPADLGADDDGYLAYPAPSRRPPGRLAPLYGAPADAEDWAEGPGPSVGPRNPIEAREAAPGGATRRFDVPEDVRPPADVAADGEEVTGAVQPRSESARREVPAQFRRQMVRYPTREPAGTIVVDTAHTYLFYVLGNGEAVRYGIGVGRDGFTWAGRERVSRMAEWPDWHPPKEMIGRQPYLPRFMAGGPGNPLGARALYLGNTIYRIHGTNEPHTIGRTVSSGCIRLLNEDVEDLYRRVSVGTQVVVLPGRPRMAASAGD